MVEVISKDESTEREKRRTPGPSLKNSTFTGHFRERKQGRKLSEEDKPGKYNISKPRECI